MKKLSKRIKFSIITDTLLVAIISVVFAISFLPNRIVPIYSANALTPIYNGNKENNGVSLMFNVYENKDVVNGILDKLNEGGVKATFFVGGCFADDNGELLKRIVKEGHEIATHGYFHKDHKTLSYQKNVEEIKNSAKVIEELSGGKITLFAPPSGSFSQDTLDACEHLGYKLIMWSKDTIDWRDSDKNLIIKRATDGLTAGDLILMHPKEHTLSILPNVIELIKEKGFSIITVGENIA